MQGAALQLLQSLSIDGYKAAHRYLNKATVTKYNNTRVIKTPDFTSILRHPPT